MYRLRVMRLLQTPANARSIIAHQCQRIAINVLAQCTLLACPSWKHSAALGAACCSRVATHFLFCSLADGGRPITNGWPFGICEGSVHSHNATTIAMMKRAGLRSRVVAISAETWLGPRFSHKMKATLERRSIFHPRVLAVRTKYGVYHFPIVIC